MLSADKSMTEESPQTKKGFEPWAVFAAGKAAVQEDDFEEAVDLFKVGQFAKELGPVYVAYGKALTRLGMENKDSLLNTSVMPDNIALETDSPESKRKKLVDLDEVKFEGDEESEVESSEAGSADEESHSQPADDLEVAWEVLDIARIIFADSASIDPKAKISLSNVYCDLGDVSMETESFTQAAEDYLKAIEIKTDLGVDHERDLSALYFKYAIALEYSDQISAAIDPLNKARDLLKLRLERLTSADDDKGKDKAGPLDAEADDLLQLIPDVEAKLEDLKSQLAAGKSNMAFGDIKATFNAAAMGAVQDLSGLVRKRKQSVNDATN